MWAATKEDQSGLICLLLYNPKTKEPVEMRIAAQKTFTCLWFSIAYISYVPWKRPAHS